jgi:hypothetical protein
MGQVVTDNKLGAMRLPVWRSPLLEPVERDNWFMRVVSAEDLLVALLFVGCTTLFFLTRLFANGRWVA